MKRFAAAAFVVAIGGCLYGLGAARGRAADAQTTALAFGALAGILGGYWLGGSEARWRRARADWRETKAKVAGLRASTFQLFGRLLQAAGAVTLIGIVAMIIAGKG